MIEEILKRMREELALTRSKNIRICIKIVEDVESRDKIEAIRQVILSTKEYPEAVTCIEDHVQAEFVDYKKLIEQLDWKGVKINAPM